MMHLELSPILSQLIMLSAQARGIAPETLIVEVMGAFVHADPQNPNHDGMDFTTFAHVLGFDDQQIVAAIAEAQSTPLAPLA